jgi:AbiJ-like protein/abortive infection Abi-like protein
VSENTISEVTRRAIVDYLSVDRHWAGSLLEDDFLARIYDLKRLPSTDYRNEFNTAAKDIWKHRVINSDWPDDWVFTDDRFDLLFGPDEQFLRFLAETVHPVVRSNSVECLTMVAEYNLLLAIDGWEVYAVKEISGKPIFGYRRFIDSSSPHLDEAKKVAERLTEHTIAQQVRRLREAVEEDPELAIGTAKEFLESLCKTILFERGVDVPKHEDMPALVRITIKTLTIVPPDIASQSHAEKTITVLLNNLGSIGHHLAEIRNQFGTGRARGINLVVST